jgi:hypothetical protein
MDRLDIFLMTTLILSFSIRLYPTIMSGLPFSTDAWPLIMNTEKLLRYTPVSLESEVFDGYNNYWPASQIFGATSSVILDARVIDVERILFPAIASLMPIPIYVIARRAIGNRVIAVISSLLIGLGGYQAIFTSGVTKETFTILLSLTYLTTALIFSSSVEKYILLLINGAAIVMAHHLQYFLLLAVSLNILVLSIFLRRVGDDFKKSLGPLVVLLVSGIVYYPLYGLRGLNFTITPSDIFSLTSFQTVSLLLSYGLLVRVGKPSVSLFIVWLASYGILFANQLFPVMPGSPKLPADILVQIAILLMLGLFIIIGLYSSHGVVGSIYPIVGWFSAVGSLEAFSIFGAQPSISLTLLYRVANHFIMPASLLAAVGLGRLVSLVRVKHLGAILVAAVLLPTSLTMVYQHYSAIILQENYLGYQGNYNVAEYEFAGWLSGKIDDLKVCGDMKIKYLLEGYFGIKVDESGGFKVLNGENPAEESLVATYKVMEKNGYVLGPYGVELKQGWVKSISDRADKIYSSTLVEAYSIG